MTSFATRVVAWHRRHGRHELPWQHDADAYRVWLSEVMLQQTQVATVLRYYDRFVSAFPDVRALAAAPLAHVLELWSGLGYYRRAHHLHAAAREVVARFDGVFPADAATLATLPGVGRSTAAAIAAFAGGERGAILDGNVRRVLARHAGIEGWPGDPRVEAMLWQEAERLLPKRAAIVPYTQGMMDLGATLCTRTRPRCAGCPVNVDCVAQLESRIGELPAPRPKKALPRRQVNVLIIEHAGRVLFERRPPTGVWPGLLGLPEVAIDEDVVRAVATRFGTTDATIEPLPPLTHVFTHFALEMRPSRVVAAAWPRAAAEEPLEWVAKEAIAGAALPSPVRRLLRQAAPA